MNRNEPCLSILVLTEDMADDGHETLVALIKKMLLLVEPRCGTHRAAFEPQNERARLAIQGAKWKSAAAADRPKLVDLGRAIAAKLLEGGGCPGFVLFHVDGDRAWAARETSENVQKLALFVERYVEPGLDAALHRQKEKCGTGDAVDERKRAALARLRTLVPFSCIEAWVFQNTAEARRLCEEAGCGRHVTKILGWEADRGALDEILKTKDELCFKSRHNLALAAGGFPYEAVFAAGKSFAAAVRALETCGDLHLALERTCAWS